MARRMAVRRRITELIESTTAVSVTISSTASLGSDYGRYGGDAVAAGIAWLEAYVEFSSEGVLVEHFAKVLAHEARLLGEDVVGRGEDVAVDGGGCADEVLDAVYVIGRG